MDFLNKLFGIEKTGAQPAIHFGRYTDSYRSPEQDDAFEDAVRMFEEDKHFEAFEAFFNYLRDEGENNVRHWQDDGKLRFEFLQGSKKVTGYADEQKFYAEGKIAKAKTLQSAFLRRLLEANYDLKYSRFILTPDNEITIVFDSYLSDSSPYKLYQGLKELATRADKHDDLLLDEFESLERIDVDIRRELPAAEKEIKYNFIINEIQSVLKELDSGKLNAAQYPVAMTYLLLSLCYKLDYLTKPEGYTMETLERIHRLAFAKDGKNAAQKNLQSRKEFQKLLDRPKEKFFREMYEVNSTFGITSPIGHKKVEQIIEQELPNMKWYYEHGYEKVALAIPGFIAGRCLFYHAPPEPDKDLLHLLFQILENDYFRQLGFPTYVDNGIPDEKSIRNAIKTIIKKHKKKFPKLNPELKKLTFNTLPKFAESYLNMVKDLDLTKAS